jgi:FSR family fosmidomycin resistance protein-like MFS transporter
MFKRLSASPADGLARNSRGLLALGALFLLIEFYDELTFGLQGAAMPALRADLRLTYPQVGLLLGLPPVLNTLIEPFLLLLGDTSLRRWLILSGGLFFAGGLLLIASGGSFAAILLAELVLYPASGAFVSLSQATLMDLNHGREGQGMARWAAAGSLGGLAGPLLLAGGFALGLGWRWAFFTLSGLALLLVITLAAQAFPRAHPSPVLSPGRASFAQTGRNLLHGLRQALADGALLRWILLLQLSDLLLDIFLGYVSLYLADVVGLDNARVAFWMGVLMFTGLAGDLLVIPLLERIPGRRLVRLSALFTALLYPALLLIPSPATKLEMLVVLRFATLGWYPVLQGEAYAAAPGRTGTVMAVGSLAGLLGGGFAWTVGWMAGQAGLPAAMWLLLLGPLGLLFGVPRAVERQT